MRAHKRAASKSACLLLTERKPPARRLPRPEAAVLAPGRSYKTPEGFPKRSRLHASSEERKRPAMGKRERGGGDRTVRRARPTDRGADVAVATSCLGDCIDLTRYRLIAISESP